MYWKNTLCFGKIWFICSTLKYVQFNLWILQVEEEWAHSSKDISKGGKNTLRPQNIICCPNVNAENFKYKRTQGTWKPFLIKQLEDKTPRNQIKELRNAEII